MLAVVSMALQESPSLAFVNTGHFERSDKKSCNVDFIVMYTCTYYIAMTVWI